MNVNLLTWLYFSGFSGEALPLRAELNEWFDWGTQYRDGEPCPACGEPMHEGTYTWYCVSCSFLDQKNMEAL